MEKEMATHSSILAWKIPWMEEPGRLLSMGSQRVGHDWSDLAAAADCSPPGPSIHGILQARTLEWVAVSFSKMNYRKKVKSLSHVRLFVTPWTVCSLPGSSLHGIFRARVLEWVVIAFVSKVMFLLFNMLSRLVIAFLPRSKHLLISWLQSPSAVIFWAQKNKVWHCFHCFPIYFPWSDGTGCHDLHFLNVEL